MKKKQFSTIGKTIFEFRFDPIISFCDWKGTLAEYLISKFNFDGFRILENRIDLINPDNQNFLIFVGMQNAGVVFENNTDTKIIKSKIGDFINALKDFEKINPQKIVRLGVRSTFLRHKETVSLQKVKESFEKNIIKLNETLYKKFDEDVMVDVGLPLSFRGKNLNYNITQGPMDKEQAISQFFTNKTVYRKNTGEIETFVPKHGLFFDVDVFKNDLGSITLDDVKIKAFDFLDSGNEKFEIISDELFNKIK